MRLFKWLTKGRSPENLSDVIATAPTMRTANLIADTWELEPDNVNDLREKLSANCRTLNEYTRGRIFRGVTTGLNDVFAIDSQTRDELISRDARSEEIIKPFIQGTHLRPWYIERSDDYLIFARRGIQIEQYPAVLEYLESHRERLEPKPVDWDNSKNWPGRKPGAYKWFEIQDTVDYWEGFEQPKIVWPDISKLPRLSMDTEQRYLGNTGYIIPGADYYLLGILSSWAIWFFISKTAQPLRLRGDRWQYRLIAQFMEQMPIPDASDSDRTAIADLAKLCCSLGAQRYDIQTSFQHRLIQTFGEGDQYQLNTKAQMWWEHSLNELGNVLKQSFQLRDNPMKNPRIADRWEQYLEEKRNEVDSLSRQLNDAELEINDRVYRLFDLTTDEIELLQREVEH
jgi:TaqI-like C-terminal specificity domain